MEAQHVATMSLVATRMQCATALERDRRFAWQFLRYRIGQVAVVLDWLADCGCQ